MTALKQQDTLRLIISGSVDDGKSTLIGRLLYDSQTLLEDQIRAITAETTGELNFATLTDGLRAEREQGITIDVAYRYFSTARRKFIVADTPGHVQYARNMFTAASTASLAILVVDAIKGITQQTKRHAYFAALLGIKQVIVAVNKMDLAGFSQATFEAIQKTFAALNSSLSFDKVYFVPVSALHGDNLVTRSDRFTWYRGPALLQLLEEIEIASETGSGSDQTRSNSRNAARLPVQWIVKDETNHSSGAQESLRSYAGQLNGGSLSVGDEVAALPSGLSTRIKAIQTHDHDLETATPPLSIRIALQDELDVGRGDILAPTSSLPKIGTSFKARFCWLDSQPLRLGRFYQFKLATKSGRLKVTSIDNKLDVESLALIDLSETTEPQTLNLNEVGTVKVQLASTVAYDLYEENRTTGSLIIIDEQTNATVAAGLIVA